MQPSTPPISVDWAKEMAFFRAAFLKVEPRFDPKLADRNILNSLFAWVWKLDEYNKLKLDYNKGFCFYGDIGLGKSMTLQALRQYRNGLVSRNESKREDFRMKGTWLKAASELANIFSVDGQPALIKYTTDEINLIIDELGREPRPAKYFGTELNVIQFVLQLRYDHRRDSVTHITTNLKLEDIAQKYGAYIADRCLEMFNFIEFKGASLRSKIH
jgi:DNA replication protein DnaC